MIKLKTQVVKKHLIEELKKEAKSTYEYSWQPKIQEKAFINGAESLFKLLRLYNDESGVYGRPDWVDDI